MNGGIIFFESYDLLYNGVFTEKDTISNFIKDFYSKLNKDKSIIKFEKIEEKVENNIITITLFITYTYKLEIETFTFFYNGTD